jgi:hypothetical protein
MFKQTAATLWRRLTSRRQVPEASVAAAAQEDDRRTHGRQPTDVPTRCAQADNPSAVFEVRVRNVSPGGVKVILDHPLTPGTLLTLNLPAQQGTEETTVLACVVHCTEASQGEWLAGCSFSGQLDVDDLVRFGARPSNPADHRAFDRRPCNVSARCLLVGGEAEGAWDARVLNISPAGMAVHVTRDIPNGSLLSAQLQGTPGRAPLTILACVVHVANQTDGAHVLGCNFIRELRDEDLQQLFSE